MENLQVFLKQGCVLIINDQSIRVDQGRKEILKGLHDRHTAPLVAGGLT